MMTVGELIAVRRKILGITAAELAQKIGKSRATLYRYETGASKLPADIVPPLAKALQLDAAQLIAPTPKTRDFADNLDDETAAVARKYSELPPDERQKTRAFIDDLHKKISAKKWHPQITAKDLRQIDKDFAALKPAQAAYMDEVKDPALFEAAIKKAMTEAKLRAKKLYTPKKYRQG